MFMEKKYFDLFTELSTKGVDLSDSNNISLKIVTKVVAPQYPTTHTGSQVIRNKNWFAFLSQAIIEGTEVVISEKKSEDFTCGSLWEGTPQFDSRKTFARRSLPDLTNTITWRQSFKEENREVCKKQAYQILAILEQLYWEKKMA
jgi:hypothetical protein